MNPSKGLKSSMSNPVTIRFTTGMPMLFYPAGCLLFLLLPDRWDPIGGGMIFIGLFAFFLSLPSYVNRIVFVPRSVRYAGGHTPLDELEIDLRRRAYAFAHQVFVVLTLAGIMYMVIASDLMNAGKASWWMPSVDDHWIAILVGALLFALLLPMHYLAWTLPRPVFDDSPTVPEDAPAARNRESIAFMMLLTGMMVGLVLDNMWFWAVLGAGVGAVAEIVMKRISCKK